MSDTISMLPVDDPHLGWGFFGDCNGWLRNADNTYQYPCSGGIHDCGQLLSGCVWSTRNEMVASGIANYTDLLMTLAVNSVMLHSGDMITPQITIDWLTLDDDDGNIGNGTPHYPEICAGFGVHNMDCPPLLVGLVVSPLDDYLAEGPGGGPFTPPTKDYVVENLGPGALQYQVTTAAPWITITNGSGTLANVGDTVTVTVEINANANSLPDGSYDALVEFKNLTDGVGDTTRDVTLNVGIPLVIHEWLFDTDPGWSTAGQWAWGQPTGGGSYNGDPTSGATGNNVYGYNLYGDYGNNLPSTYLTSEVFDCTGLFNVTLSFQRWLGVESNSNYDEATIEVSNGGAWTVVWRATDTGVAISDNAWTLQEVDLSDVADDQASVQVRWGMGPTDTNLTYPGWNLDDVQIIALGGTPPALSILLPGGTPESVPPATPTPISVQIVDGGEVYVPGTGLLHYRYDGGNWQTTPLTLINGNLYEAMLSAAACTDTPEFYFSAQGDQGTVVYHPKGAPNQWHATEVGTLTMVMDDDFETNTGWTAINLGATSGDWERGVPVNDPSWDYDPASDYDGSGQCYLTENQFGNTDVDNGAVRLDSPLMDFSAGGVTISYAYYLRLTNSDGSDRLLVQISSNGASGPFVEIARHDTDGGLSWRLHTITEADLQAAGVSLTANMQMRFTANDGGTQSIVEAGLDAFKVSSFSCVPPAVGACCYTDGSCAMTAETACSGTWMGLGTNCDPNPCPAPWCLGDANCSGGAPDFLDVQYFVSALTGEQAWIDYHVVQTGSGPSCPFAINDLDGGGVGFSDIESFVEHLGAPCDLMP
jgi:hypothetical protein